MSLLTSELQRLKYELDFTNLEVGAEPYIGIAAIFEKVVQPYLNAGASTTSATAVLAATAPTPTTITVASATGVSAWNTLVVDVDDRQESATITAVSGSLVTLPLAKAHSGTYPVTVEGGEAIIRSILTQLRNVDERQRSAMKRAGIKKVEEVEFFQQSGSGGSSVFDDLRAQREYWRKELTRVLHVGNSHVGGGGCTTEVY